MTELVVLSDGLLKNLTTQPQFTSEFPFLKVQKQPQTKASAAPNSGGEECAPCARAAQEKKKLYNSMKAAIANMSPAKQSRFCQLLKANNVRIAYKNANDMLVKATIHQ